LNSQINTYIADFQCIAFDFSDTYCYTNQETTQTERHMHITNFTFHKKNGSIFEKILSPLSITNTPIHAIEPAECHWCGYHLSDDRQDCPNCDNNNTHPKQPIPLKNEEQNNDFFAFKPINALPATNAPAPALAEEPLECAWCSYHLSNIEEDCPNCGYNPTAQEDAELPKMQLIHQNDQAAYSFEGDIIRICGNNLQNNAQETPISSDITAKFECIDGAWYLSNENPEQPIFIQVNGKTPISTDQLVVIQQQTYLFSGHPLQ
jgi:predicted Zn-ribbon and HTH transcriptional regulator